MGIGNASSKRNSQTFIHITYLYPRNILIKKVKSKSDQASITNYYFIRKTGPRNILNDIVMMQSEKKQTQNVGSYTG